MPSNDYHFVTTWHVPATREEISEVIGDATGLGRWWPSVYLDVVIADPGGPDGVGRVVRLYTKGWLPYTLRWEFTVTSADPPAGFSLEARGDFVGRGIWTFEVERPADDPAGPMTSVTYDWLVLAEKGILKTLSPVMKPIFGANHRWAMARGEESLNLELARRRTTDPIVRAAIRRPPGPTFPHNLRRARR